MGPTPTRMRLLCNFVNVYTIVYRVQYTFTRMHARIPNGQPREDPREEKHACRSSRRTSRRVVRVRQAERRSRRTRRLPRERMSVSVSVPWNLSLGAYIAHISDWLNTTFGFVDGGPTSARMPPVNATNVSRSDGDWQSWTQEAAAAAGWQNDTLTGVEPNRANYTALIGELYDDFEHISETYLLRL